MNWKLLSTQLVLLCVLTQCAMLPSGNYQSGRVMDKGGQRFTGQFETGLHIEEAMYSQLNTNEIEQGHEP